MTSFSLLLHSERSIYNIAVWIMKKCSSARTVSPLGSIIVKVLEATCGPAVFLVKPVSSRNSRKAACSKDSLGSSPPPGVAQYDFPLKASFSWQKLKSSTRFSGERIINRDDGRVRTKPP